MLLPKPLARCHPNAKHSIPSVGYGACDVPQPFRTMSPKRGANETPCRGESNTRVQMSPPYKSTATSTVGEGCSPLGRRHATATSTVGEGCSPLGRRHEVTVGEASPPRNAPPATIVKMPTNCEANPCFRRVRRLRRTARLVTHSPKRKANACFRRNDHWTRVSVHLIFAQKTPYNFSEIP